MVVDNYAAIAVKDFASRGEDGEGLHAVAFGLLGINLLLLNLKLPEAGKKDKEDGNGDVLEHGHFGRGEFRVVAEDLLRGDNLLLLLLFRGDGGTGHCSGTSPFVLV